MEPHHSEERGGLGPRGAEWSRVWLADLMLEPDSTEAKAPTYPQVTVRGGGVKAHPRVGGQPALLHLYGNEDRGPWALSVTQLLKPSDRMKVHLLTEK